MASRTVRTCIRHRWAFISKQHDPRYMLLSPIYRYHLSNRHLTHAPFLSTLLVDTLPSLSPCNGHPYPRMYSCTCTHRDTRTHTEVFSMYTHTHTHTRTYVSKRVFSHTPIYICTHTHAHTAKNDGLLEVEVASPSYSLPAPSLPQWSAATWVKY